MDNDYDEAKREAKKYFNPLHSKCCWRCTHSFQVTYGLWCKYGGMYVTPDGKCKCFEVDDYYSLEKKINL